MRLVMRQYARIGEFHFSKYCLSKIPLSVFVGKEDLLPVIAPLDDVVWKPFYNNTRDP